MLPNGKYRTKAGSEMQISGTHGGISRVWFDGSRNDRLPRLHLRVYRAGQVARWQDGLRDVSGAEGTGESGKSGGER